MPDKQVIVATEQDKGWFIHVQDFAGATKEIVNTPHGPVERKVPVEEKVAKESAEAALEYIKEKMGVGKKK